MYICKFLCYVVCLYPATALSIDATIFKQFIYIYIYIRSPMGVEHSGEGIVSRR